LWLGILFAVLIILRAEIGVAEDLVGFADGLEALVGRVIAGVLVCRGD
jgi:hypothetical protein